MPDINFINDSLLNQPDLAVSNVFEEKESQEYSAASFFIDKYKIIYRHSKITPAKTGRFVTIWKRNDAGITRPFDIMDDFDFMMIAAVKEANSGIFIFSKDTLRQHGVVSINGTGGKRGMRVYPPWDVATNKQAIKTQEWQTKHFINLNKENDAAADTIAKIFS